MYFLTVVEVGKSKMTVLANLPPDGDPLPLQTAASVAGSSPGHSSKHVHRHTQRSPFPPNATSASWIKTSVLLPHLICVQSLSCVWLFATLWTVTHQALLSMGFSRQEWVAIPFSRDPFSRPRNRTQVSCIAGRFFTIWASREAPFSLNYLLNN